MIWLVEDNTLHAQMVTQAFDDEEIRVFDNGASLLEHVAAKPPLADAIILDMHLPDMSGLEVCRFLRSTHDEIALPILILTAQGHKSDIVEGLTAGANDYLTKPFDKLELRARMASLLRMKRLNEDRQKYRELMLAMIGHDLRNPLSAITTGTDAILMLEGSTEAHHRVVARMRSSSARMSRMIEQVLDFTRSRFGGIEVKKRPIELEEMVQQCAEEFELAAPDAQLVLEVTNCRGHWDADRMSQVIGNLLSNARNHGAKHTPITLRARCDQGTAVVEVTNQGDRIPEALVSIMFDPFRRGETLGPRPKGLGLGLYIAKQIVDGHGGSIGVVSTDSETTFTVRLPLTA